MVGEGRLAVRRPARLSLRLGARRPLDAMVVFTTSEGLWQREHDGSRQRELSLVVLRRHQSFLFRAARCWANSVAG